MIRTVQPHFEERVGLGIASWPGLIGRKVAVRFFGGFKKLYTVLAVL